MQFNSYTFVVFFIAILAVYYTMTSWTSRKAWLLVTSYLFYAAWDPVFIVLLWASTLVDWKAAAIIDRAQTQARRRALMIVSVVVNLGFLGYFKYGGFVLENVVAGLNAIGIDYHPAEPDIVLPIGISFYTFHSLSYTLDVYLRRTKPWTSFLDFALYVTFFPQLVAGPILRANYFLPQCTAPRRATREMFGWGLTLLALGLFSKNVIADVLLAPAVDDAFATDGRLAAADAWTGTLAFAGQIFADFAGYSTCAIGVSLCLGFSIPDNFRFPYAAIGFSDFWKRWHISLSSWLRDYLYIPLGGNRDGPTRTQVNLMLTMLIGGLWHGASWTFVVWGGLHGAYLIGERHVVARLPPGVWRDTAWAKLVGVAVTFFLVCVAWVFFRAQTFDQAFTMVGSMFGAGEPGAWDVDPRNRALVGTTVALILAVHWYMRDRTIEQVAARTPPWARSVAIAIMLIAIVLFQGSDRAFIYFQF